METIVRNFSLPVAMSLIVTIYSDGDANPTLMKRIRNIRLLPRKIPISYHVGCVIMSWLSSVLSGVVYSYNVSVPFHMVFKSSILLVNMAIGYIVMKRRCERKTEGKMGNQKGNGRKKWEIRRNQKESKRETLVLYL